MSPRPSFRFADFVVEPDESRVRRDGDVLHVEPKAIEVLTVLLEHAGELVRKEELLREVWRDAFVSDSALTKAVARLRDVLDDDARAPRFIETVPTLGYRFIGELRSESAEPTTAARRAVVLAVATVSVAVGVTIATIARTGDPESTGVTAADAPPLSRVLVLPFDNLGADDQNEVVDGIHDALLSSLARIPSLRVISRTTALQYDGADRPLPEIAAELEVRYVVEGTVLTDGDRVRISAQLIDGRSDEHLWAAGYEQPLGDVLRLLSSVATSIAEEIEVTLTPQQRERLQQPTVDPAAQEAYLRGRFHLNQLTRNGAERSLEQFAAATAIDPEFAAAHAALAYAGVMQALFGFEEIAGTVERARASATRALELDPDLGDAHAANALVSLYFDWDWEAAGDSFRRALALDPCNAITLHGMADYLTILGRAEDGLRHVEEGRRCDPASVLAIGPLAGHLLFTRRYDRGVDEFRSLLAARSDVPGVRTLLSAALWHQGHRDESAEVAREARAADAELVAALDRGLAESGPAGGMLKLGEAIASRARRGGRGDPLVIAALLARGGDLDHALEWLETGLERRSPMLPLHLAADPDYDPLREHPRYVALLEEVGLPR